MKNIFNLKYNKRAFTLIELMVVIGIIGVLATIVTAFLNGARESGRMAANTQFEANILHGIGDQLVGEWKFDDGSGKAYDTSGFNNNGTLNGGPRYYPNGGYNGKGAYYFNGSQNINAVVKNINTTNNITFTAWVKGYAVGSLTGIVTFPNNGTGVIADLNNQLRFVWADSYSTVPTGLNMTKDKWNFVAMSVTPTKISLYLNDKTFSYPNPSIFLEVNFNNGNGNLKIGQYKSNISPSWMGYIDNVRVYTAPITTAQIEQLYAEGLSSHQDLALTK